MPAAPVDCKVLGIGDDGACQCVLVPELSYVDVELNSVMLDAELVVWVGK